MRPWSRTFRRKFLLSIACIALAAVAVWSGLIFLESRDREWAREARESQLPGYPAADSALWVGNAFAGWR